MLVNFFGNSYGVLNSGNDVDSDLKETKHQIIKKTLLRQLNNKLNYFKNVIHNEKMPQYICKIVIVAICEYNKSRCQFYLQHIKRYLLCYKEPN